MTRIACLLALGTVLLAGCHRMRGPERADSLAGLVLPLVEGTTLVTPGEVDGRPARIVLDTALPYTTVTRGCWKDVPAPASPGSVKVPEPGGRWVELPEIALRSARIGPARLGTRTVGLTVGETCTLTLGLDVLAAYTLTLDPARRELSVAPSGAALPTGERLALTREPTRDWWLLTLKLEQEEASVVGPFVLSTGTPVTTLSSSAAQGGGFVSAADLLSPSQRKAAPERLINAPIRVGSVALSEKHAASGVPLARSGSWRDEVAIGVLAADVLGRFVTTIDVGKGVLVLAVRESGHEVQLRERDGRRWLNAAMWSAQDAGVQLRLEAAGSDSPCVLGVSFPAGTQGRSLQLPLPWDGLAASMPECAALLEGTPSLTVSAQEQGSHRICTGSCAFAERADLAKVSCACEPTPFLSAAEEAVLLEQHRVAQGADGGVPLVPGWADELPEPVDP